MHFYFLSLRLLGHKNTWFAVAFTAKDTALILVKVIKRLSFATLCAMFVADIGT